MNDKILLLEALYGQKGLAQKLGVSPSTVWRYRNQKTKPRKNIETKINRIHGQKRREKSKPEVVKKINKIYARRRSFRQISLLDLIDQYQTPDFIVENLEETLTKLHDAGFVGRYQDDFTKTQFLMWYEQNLVIGETLKIVTIDGREYEYVGKGVKDAGKCQTFSVLNGFGKMRMNKNDSLEERYQKVLNYTKTNKRFKKTRQIIGFYFEEGDEI